MTEDNKPTPVDGEANQVVDETQAVDEAQASETTESVELTSTDPAAHDEIDLNDDVEEDELVDNEAGDPYGGHSAEALKRIMEAAVFASGTTLSPSHLRALFEGHERPHRRVVKELMAELIAYHEARGLQLIEVASGYRFQTDASAAQWVARLWDEKPQRYSRALMETIALIAYRQPITRGEIEDVRGVAVSSNIIRTLLERQWVRVVGHRDVPGRPAMYATTRQFLDYFSLNSLDQMPSLSEIRDLSELNPQMNLESMEGDTKPDSDEQSVISFSDVIDGMRDRADGKTGSEFIDEHLDGELKAMDEVNTNFEHALAKQKAELEHPNLALDQQDDAQEVSVNSDAVEPELSEPSTVDTVLPNQPEQAVSEEEQWKIIQEKLAQQQALLDDRESDSQSEEDNNE